MLNGHGLKLTALTAAVVFALGTQAQQSQGDRSHSSAAQQQQQQHQPEQQRQDQRSTQSSDARSERTADQRRDQRTEQRSDDMSFDELAEKHSDLSDFVAAVKSAGLEDSLSDGTNYTIFAPTNSAFDDQQGTSLQELMRTENQDQLVGLLRAHIVADDLDLSTARELPAATTIDGGQVDLTEQDGTLMVGDAKLADDSGIRMGNIRVFPIDGVLAQNPSDESSPQASNRQQSRADR